MDFNIGSYLEKFKNITPPDDFLKTIFISAAQEEIGADIQKKDIKVQNGVVYVSAPPALKSELYIRKQNILDRMKEQLEGKKIPDVR